ncbi:MAG: hypothetical protein KTR14_01800 [Vampirovibrio sp.]|nr:hypothetical protein [Vampirovibrio sp.]
MHLSTLDILILFAFIGYAIWSGWQSKGVASKNLEEYFLAGRSLPGWKAGISMAATQFSADTPLLVAGLIATAGIFSLWRLWIYALSFLLMGFLLAASWRRAKVLTDAELTELRYGDKPAAVLRGTKAIYLGTIFNCTVLAMVLKAATGVAEPFLVWDQWLPSFMFDPMVSLVQSLGLTLTLSPEGVGDLSMWVRSANNLISILAIVTVTAFYSTTGGLRSVVNTDVVQFFIMMAGTAAFAWMVADHVGGFGAIPERIQAVFAAGGPGGITSDQILAFTPSHAKDVTIFVLLAFAIQWLAQMNADGTGYLAQRSMACRTDHDAKQAAIVFTIAQVFFRSLLWLPIGLGLLLLFPPDLSLDMGVLKADREASFVRGMAELLPSGVKGLMLTGMLAALASTVDTHLNWGASYWTNDIYKRFFCRHILKREPSDRSLVWVARGSNFLILAIALFIMTRLNSIQEAWQISLLMGAGVGVFLVLRWLWWRVNAWGEIACILTSLVMAPVLITTIPVEQDAIRLLIATAVATLIGIVVSYAVGPEKMVTLQHFYQNAHPPGFWKPVAQSLGEENPNASFYRFARGISAVVVCSFSIFCLLVAVGTWLCHSPAPTWFPWWGAWIALLFVVGIALIPVWWRLGFIEPVKAHSLTQGLALNPNA